MTITAAERAEINRQNSRRSTGPKSPRGKSHFRLNEIKHGCRAKLSIIPGEDPDVYQDRLDSWVDKFDPRDPVELYLVERAVRASWQLDRADRAELARLADEATSNAEDAVAKADEMGATLFRAPQRHFGTARFPAGPVHADCLRSLQWSNVSSISAVEVARLSPLSIPAPVDPATLRENGLAAVGRRELPPILNRERAPGNPGEG